MTKYTGTQSILSRSEALRDRALAQSDAGDLQGALRTIAEAIELDENDARAYAIRGGIHGQCGHDEAAESDFLRSIELDPLSIAPLWMRWDYRFNRGDIDGALEDLRKVADLDPDNPDAYASIGHVMAVSENYEQAMPFLSAALQLDPEQIGCYCTLGSLPILRMARSFWK